jgi:hypothetical protein
MNKTSDITLNTDLITVARAVAAFNAKIRPNKPVAPEWRDVAKEMIVRRSERQTVYGVNTNET